MPEQPTRETPKAAAAFAEYCELGVARSLAKLAHKWGKNTSYVGQLERWSSAYGWQERVKAWDAERATEKLRKHDEEIEAMNTRHALIGTSQQRQALEQIKALVEAKKFGSQASVQLLKLATDLERLARGAPTERAELTGKDGDPLTAGVNVVFYLPKLAEEKGDGNYDDSLDS